MKHYIKCSNCLPLALTHALSLNRHWSIIWSMTVYWMLDQLSMRHRLNCWQIGILMRMYYLPTVYCAIIHSCINLHENNRSWPIMAIFQAHIAQHVSTRNLLETAAVVLLHTTWTINRLQKMRTVLWTLVLKLLRKKTICRQTSWVRAHSPFQQCSAYWYRLSCQLHTHSIVHAWAQIDLQRPATVLTHYIQ